MNNHLAKKEKWAYGLAGLGQNMVYNYATAYIMVFYTDVVKLLPLAVGTLLLVARIFDALNDPLMGLLIDRPNRRKEKLLPFLRWIIVPMFVSTILIFVIPFESMAARLIYAYVSFIAWDLVYTVSDIPFWGLSVLIHPDQDQRLSILTYARVLSNVGLAISIVIPPLMIAGFGSNQSAYLITAVVMAGIGSLLFSLVGFFTKERVQTQNEDNRFHFKDLFKSKDLWILQSSRVLSAFRMVIATAGLYYAKYNLQNEAQFSIMGGLLILAMILAMFVTPSLRKRFTKKNLYLYSLLLGFFAHMMLFILGDASLIILYIALFLSGLSLGLGDVISYTLVGDIVLDLKQRTHQHHEGMIFATHTFTTKLQSALGLFTIGLILNATGFIENTAQTKDALFGIFSLISLLPALASLLSILPMFFFKLKDDVSLK